MERVLNNIDTACKRIAPAWPLESSVAVNPYLGLSEVEFETAAELLKRRGNINLFMPIDFYLDEFKAGKLSTLSIARALDERNEDTDVQDFIAKAKGLRPLLERLHTFTSLASSESGLELSETVLNHVSNWLAHYFNEVKYSDEHRAEDMYAKWKLDASVDLSLEITKLKNFRASVRDTPKSIEQTILFGLEKLQVPLDAIESYLHTLLLQVVGWASYCSGVDYNNQLYRDESHFVKALLAILMNYEYAIANAHPVNLTKWKASLSDHERSESNNDDAYMEAAAIFQAAYDIEFQNQLIKKINDSSKNGNNKNNISTKAQMVFCIDVRSEVYRRSIEEVNPAIETVGFAGFFGFPIKYEPVHHINGKNQCPVLIPSGVEVKEACHNENQTSHLKQKRANRGVFELAWKSLKQSSVSSYGYVSPLGAYSLIKLLGNSLGITRPVEDPKSAEFGDILEGKTALDLSQISLSDRVAMAKSALTAMGIKNALAPFVIITGHGASSANNPHASGLDCGACGGNSGEINALTAQLILNDHSVRQELFKEGIEIPQNTLFVAALHNTTTDEITILDRKVISSTRATEFGVILKSLEAASSKARVYRSTRLGLAGKAIDKSIKKRANDWAQVRPEWGLSGCSSFIIAPRERTKGVDLEGKAFLHSYDWKADEGFNVLEAIMTAPMIVTSWINLQYYASTTDNDRLGAGNKTLHNVTSSIGVLEGAKGDLRIGLPWQSIHDGKDYQHLPIRLNVVIEAPKRAINEVLTKHANVQELFDNKWIQLFAMDEEGQITHKYEGNLDWDDLRKSNHFNLVNTRINKKEFSV